MTKFYHNSRTFVCISILWLIRIQVFGAIGKYPIQNFTPTDYKAGIQNIDFAQNRNTTLFVANNLGVLSFNGHQWDRHDFKTGKKKRSLAFDEHENRLYVGSQGDFGFFEGDWRYQSLVDLVPENQRDFDEVWDVFQLNSKVYFCTFQGIFVYDGATIDEIQHKDGLERSFVTNGKLFTQTQEGQIFEIDNQQELTPILPQEPSRQTIAGIISHEGGYLLFYNSGVIDFTTPYGTVPKFEELRKALQGTYVNHVNQLSDTRLVISTQTSGLFLYDLQKETLETINIQDGLASNACLRTFQDFAGNLWVGMQNGIAMININSPMRLLNQEINIQGSGYDAYETQAGTYFTTSNGIYFLAKGETQSQFLDGSEGPAYSIQKIADKLYAGHHHGLFLLANGKAKQLVELDGLWQLKQLRSNPGFAIGGTYSGLFLFRITETSELEPLQKIRGFTASSRFFEEDQMGKIWAGQYYKGLYRLDLNEDLTTATVKNLSEGSSLPIKEQIILSKIDGGLFLATNAGLFQLEPNEGIIQETTLFSSEIGKQPVYLFEQDQKNNVHLIAENSVGFFKQISAGNYQFIPSSLYQLRYLLNNDLLNIAVHTNQGILFSANEGFIRYDPELEPQLKLENPLVIKQVFSVTENTTLYQRMPFEKKADRIGELTISPKTKVLKFEVESFQFKSTDGQQYRYLLEGFDDQYSDWTTSSVKEYTNLNEGTYQFTAQSKNYLGEITNSTPLSLIVQPPFYRSMIAKILYLIAGLSIIFLVSRFQKSRYKQKTRKIEHAKQLALAREQEKMQHMEQQKEKELLQLKEEKMESELRHVNRLLAASTMNLVVKNEFIESIKEELKTVNQKDKKSETKRALEKIVKEIDITLRLQEDWEQFEYHFGKIHGDFLSRIRKDFPDLSPNEQKLCTFLRLNLNTKEIANLLSISLRGVEVARYRLRKKLALERGQNLSKFILEY